MRPRTRDRIDRAATLAVVLLLAVGLAGWSFLGGIARDNLSSDDFDRAYEFTPQNLSLPYQVLRIPSGDLGLAAWWVPADAAANGTVLLVHGHSANMGKSLQRWGGNLHDAGYDLLAIDLRNHGGSDRTPHGFVGFGTDEADDVVAAVAYLRDHAEGLGIDPDRVVLYGSSMGAATVLLAADRLQATGQGVQAVVSDSGFSSFAAQAREDGAKDGYPGFIVDWVVGLMDLYADGAPPSGSQPDQVIAGLTAPLLLAHCANDGRITDRAYDTLLDAATAAGAGGPDLTTWHEECADGLSATHHVDGWTTPGYNATVVGFLASAFGR